MSAHNERIPARSVRRGGVVGKLLGMDGQGPIRSSMSVWPARRDVYRAKLVFYLFLISLGVFFAAGMATYAIIRVQAFQPIEREYLALRLPVVFVASTVSLVFVSGFLQLAVVAVRREQQVPFRRWLVGAWLSAAVFLTLQYFGMHDLLGTHFAGEGAANKVYGMCFIMALLHALHVVGGLGFLGFVIFRGFTNAYDHERHYAVEHCAAYWHFLDGVWVVMLAVFFITG